MRKRSCLSYAGLLPGTAGKEEGRYGQPGKAVELGDTVAKNLIEKYKNN